VTLLSKHKLSIASIFLFLIVLYCFLNAGFFLHLKKTVNKQQNQVIFIFVGTLSDRVLAASDLYHSTTSSKIVYGKTVDTEFKFLDSLGIQQCSNTDKIRWALSAVKVPDSNIITLEAQNRNTLDEANLMLDFLKKNQNIKRIALVTSSYHTRRAYMILNDRLSNLDREVSIDVYSNNFTNFNANKWWRSKTDAVFVFTEYLKICSFLVWEQFV
jgi:uncharacterized SAM-binding protein YcdF (DUF218 family)